MNKVDTWLKLPIDHVSYLLSWHIVKLRPEKVAAIRVNGHYYDYDAQLWENVTKTAEEEVQKKTRKKTHAGIETEISAVSLVQLPGSGFWWPKKYCKNDQ